MARGGTSTGPSHAGELPVKTLVVDAGAYTIKAGFAPTEQSSSPDPVRDCLVIPNCIARSRDKHVYVGSELAKCTDFGEMVFRRPVEKGYIVNWEAESAIWEHEFLMKDAQLHVRRPSPSYMSLRREIDHQDSATRTRPTSSSPSPRMRLMQYNQTVTRLFLKSLNSLPTTAV